MSKDSVRQWDPTAANNLDVAGITLAENQTLPSMVNGIERAEMAQVAQYLVEMSYPVAGGTANALTLTPTTALAALASNQAYSFKAASANTTAATLAVSGLTAKAIRKIVGGTDVALAANDIQANGRYTVVYDTAANGAAGAWILTGTPPEVGVAIDGLTAKTTLAGGDEMTIADSAASFAGKKATLTNLLKMLNVSGNFNLALDLSGAAAGQIVFPAAQNASANVNTLDDYEEGTWTPTVKFGGAAVGLTYSIQTAIYLKVGRLVYIGGTLALSAKGSSTGQMTIESLPFTVGSGSNSSIPIAFYGPSSTVTGNVMGLVIQSGTQVQLFQGGAAGSGTFADTNATNTLQIQFGGVYMASA